MSWWPREGTRPDPMLDPGFLSDGHLTARMVDDASPELPAMIDDESEFEPASDERTDSGSRSPTILIVEDDEDTRHVYSLFLETQGYRVISETSGEAGLERASSRVADLVIMDVSIPGIDGWTVTRRLKEDESTADIPVIVITAHAFPEDREMATKVGADGFLTKPCSPRALFEEIEGLLGR